MIKINFVCGMSCVGKSYYIENNKNDNDTIIDVFKYQQEIKNFLTAEYTFYSQIELILHNVKDGTIWIEVPFYKHYRRKAVISFFKTLAEGLEKDVEWNLIYIQASSKRYANNIKLRFPGRSDEESSDFYEERLKDVEVPTQEELIDGWNTVKIISLD